MTVQSPMSFAELAHWQGVVLLNELGSDLEDSGSIRRFFGDPNEGQQAACLVDGEFRRVVIAIGPEGGFSEGEIEQAKSLGFEAIRLGESILRIETAAIAAGIVFGLGRRPSSATR